MAVETFVYSLPMRIRFRGLSVREGMIICRDGVWSEWSPFVEYDDAEAAVWLRAALEVDDPPLVRASVPLNLTVPAVDAQTAAQMVRESPCRTVKVKVAGASSSLDDDVARVASVREALGPLGHVRVDANGAWSLPQAVEALRELGQFNLQYAEQPVASVEHLALLRRQLDAAGIAVPIAADESIRRGGDYRKVKGVADVAVLKVQPLGGVQRLLDVAAVLDMPVVVSSALETSIGIHAGVRAAACLPDLHLACGLDTVRLLDGDVVTWPLASEYGAIRVAGRPQGDCGLLAEHAASLRRTTWWQDRLARCQAILDAGN